MSRSNVFPLLIMLTLIATGCDLTPFGPQDEITPATEPAFATATPGGVISVWLLTPTGQAGPGLATAAITAEVIGPAATATAVQATANAATATALAPTNAATYQPDECPAPGNPPPPIQPTNFSEYPEAIGMYLSAGGAPAILETVLRNWAALTDAGGLIQADVDLTGDGIVEIIVALLDPRGADLVPQPGQLLVFGCDNNGYRLLFASQASLMTGLPELLRVGDMNGNVTAELVYSQEICDGSACVPEAQILSWNATLGSFVPLNSGALLAPNGYFTIADTDTDGILEITVQRGVTAAPGVGPQRASAELWDWNGTDYLLASVQIADPDYRIHVLHDADAELLQGRHQAAARLYNDAIFNDTYLTWTARNERQYLNAYARFRLLLAFALEGDFATAEAHHGAILTENPEGSPAYSYAQMGDSFWADWSVTRNVSTACARARALANSRPDILAVLNSFGTANRVYAINDLCPY